MFIKSNVYLINKKTSWKVDLIMLCYNVSNVNLLTRASYIVTVGATRVITYSHLNSLYLARF